MEIDGQLIQVQKWWIEDCIRLRIEKFGVKIDDLFLCLAAPIEGDTFIETSYGKLRTFFTKEMPKGKIALILHRNKYPYPRKHNPIENLPNEKMDYARERIN